MLVSEDIIVSSEIMSLFMSCRYEIIFPKHLNFNISIYRKYCQILLPFYCFHIHPSKPCSLSVHITLLVCHENVLKFYILMYGSKTKAANNSCPFSIYWDERIKGQRLKLKFKTSNTLFDSYYDIFASKYLEY